MACISFHNVSIDIPVYDIMSRSLKKILIHGTTGGKILSEQYKKVTVRAIENVSLCLGHGTRLGLIGHNGAGKSTLLRVMSGIYEPSSGKICVEGHVAPLFDIGFGMDPDSTGWENIILRGLFLGYTLKKIKENSNKIAKVSGLGEFLNMPLRTYSTGMATRLAFAVSTSITPDILLIDEGIGTGDAAFLKEAEQRLERFIGLSKILVMASHSGELLKKWCTDGLWMEHGKMIYMGNIEDTLYKYEKSLM